MSAARTPTPWKAGRDDMQSYECSEAMTPVTHIYATTVFEPKKHLGHKLPLTIARTEGGNNKADAAFIVRACNSHDALVAALEEFMDQTDGALGGGLTPRGLEDVIEIYRGRFAVALKAAKGEA